MFSKLEQAITFQNPINRKTYDYCVFLNYGMYTARHIIIPLHNSVISQIL